MEQNYVAPEVRVIEVRVEKGFATSYGYVGIDTDGYGDAD